MAADLSLLPLRQLRPQTAHCQFHSLKFLNASTGSPLPNVPGNPPWPSPAPWTPSGLLPGSPPSQVPMPRFYNKYWSSRPGVFFSFSPIQSSFLSKCFPTFRRDHLSPSHIPSFKLPSIILPVKQITLTVHLINHIFTPQRITFIHF